jgi:hypothetical protein
MTEPLNFKSGGTQIFKALLAHFCPLSGDIRMSGKQQPKSYFYCCLVSFVGLDFT